MCIRQSPAHLVTKGALLRAVRFVHQHNDFVPIIQAFGITLIDLDILEFEDGGNQNSPAVLLNVLAQFLAALHFNEVLNVCTAEGFVNLTIEISPIHHHQNGGVFEVIVGSQHASRVKHQ